MVRTPQHPHRLQPPVASSRRNVRSPSLVGCIYLRCVATSHVVHPASPPWKHRIRFLYCPSAIITVRLPSRARVRRGTCSIHPPIRGRHAYIHIRWSPFSYWSPQNGSRSRYECSGQVLIHQRPRVSLGCILVCVLRVLSSWDPFFSAWAFGIVLTTSKTRASSDSRRARSHAVPSSVRDRWVRRCGGCFRMSSAYSVTDPRYPRRDALCINHPQQVELGQQDIQR